MSKLNRLKKLDGSKTTEVTPKDTSMAQVVEQLKAIAMAQQESQEAVTKSIEQLSKVILLAADEGVDVSAVVKAIEGLQEQMARKSQPLDYEINFERDKNLLMKSGVRLTAHPSRKLN